MDECEFAAWQAQRFNDACIEAQRARARAGSVASESARYCAQCDKPIPEARRRAQPGCTLCVPCQARTESGTVHG